MLKPILHLPLFVLLAFTATAPAAADDIAKAALDLCEKVKACAMAQINEEDLTPEMRQMMQPMLDSMCANMKSRVQAVPIGHAMYAPAVACMRSMESLSCEDMQTAGAETPACQAYEKLARETYGEP